MINRRASIRSFHGSWKVTNTKMTRSNAWKWTLVIAWAAYAAPSTHRLAGGDSGELLAEACVGGVAHPPGYPLLLLILHAANRVKSYLRLRVPFVVLANHVNAFIAASAAACVTHAVDIAAGPGHDVEAIGAGLIFAFSRLTWEYALGLEVFALNNLVCGMLVVLFIRHTTMETASKTRSAYLGAVVCGLGLANQHTIVLLELPLICWIVGTTRFTVGQWVRLSLCFLVGLSPYAWLSWAARSPTRGSWGDCSTLAGFITHLFRREYGTFQLSPQPGSSDTLMPRLKFYAMDTLDELSPIAAGCALIGMCSSLYRLPLPDNKGPQPRSPTDKSVSPPPSTRQNHPLLALVISLVIYVLVFNSLANIPLDDPLGREVTRRFFMQPNLVVCVFTGLGLTMLRHILRRVSTQAGHTTTTSIILAAIFVASQYHRNHATFHTSTGTRHDWVKEFGVSVLHRLPQDAILLSYTDIQWNTVRYLQACELARPDVTHINLQVMAYPWFSRQEHLYSVDFPASLRQKVSTNRTSQAYATYLSRFIDANSQRKRPIFLDLHGVDEATITGDQLLFNKYQALPHGFVWRIAPVQSPTRREAAWKTYALQQPQREASSLLAIQVQGQIEFESMPRGSWEVVVLKIANDAKYQRNLARLGYLLTHDTIQTVRELEAMVLAYDDIQRELQEVVVHGGDAISYDRFAVMKNAVVSRLRFQLYLDGLGGVIHETGADGSSLSSRARSLVKQSASLRVGTVRLVAGFVPTMAEAGDTDLVPIQQGLETLQRKAATGSISTTRVSPSTRQDNALRQKAKKKKKKKKQNKT